jgi:rhodanese-related sulfurtransferase
MTPLTLILVLLAIALLAWPFWRARPEIPPEDLRAALQAGSAVLVDVREPPEWAASGTARDAVLLPLSDLRGSRIKWAPFLCEHPDRPLFLYCQSGARSSMAAGLLRREGFNARNAGSLAAIGRAGVPLGHPRD